MEEKFRLALEEARKNGENEEIIQRDDREIQDAIIEQQKVYIDLQRLFKDLPKIFNVSSEEVREYSKNIEDLFDRLKVLNDIIDRNARNYGVTIEKGELPFDEEELERPVEFDSKDAKSQQVNKGTVMQNYFGSPIIEDRVNPITENNTENEQTQEPITESPEDSQTQDSKIENLEAQQTDLSKENTEAKPILTEEIDTQKTQEPLLEPKTTNNNNFMKVTKKDLELAEKANNFYCGKMNGYKFSKEDMLFFANNTLEDIKKKYGENFFPVAKEDEALFDEFIKYQSLKDGLYMTKKDRELMIKNRNAIFYNKEITDSEAKELYDRFFKDCNGDEYEIAIRYNSLSIMGGKIDDIYKDIEEKFRVRDNTLEKTEQIESKPVETIPVEPKPIESKPVEPIPVEPKSVGPEPVRPASEHLGPIIPKPMNTVPVYSAPVIPTPMSEPPANQMQVNSSPVNGLEPLFVAVKVLGKKMLVNGKEYEYKVQNVDNTKEKIGEIINDVHDSPIFTKFISKEIKDDLIKMSDTLKDNNPKGKILDPNIVYAIIQVCKDIVNISGTDIERDKSIEVANEYFKKLMYQYMKYASGNFVKGTRFDDLIIEYNLKKAMKLEEEDRKAIEKWAEISKDYAKIVDIGFLQKLINKIKSIFNKNKALLLDKGQNQEKDKTGQSGAEQVQTQEKDKSFVQKVSLEQEQQATNPEPTRHINVPSKNDDHGNLEP